MKNPPSIIDDSSMGYRVYSIMKSRRPIKLNIDLSDVSDTALASLLVGMGLVSLHRLGVIHGDLTPDNVIVDIRTFEANFIDFANSSIGEIHPLHQIVDIAYPLDMFPRNDFKVMLFGYIFNGYRLIEPIRPGFVSEILNLLNIIISSSMLQFDPIDEFIKSHAIATVACKDLSAPRLVFDGSSSSSSDSDLFVALVVLSSILRFCGIATQGVLDVKRQIPDWISKLTSELDRRRSQGETPNLDQNGFVDVFKGLYKAFGSQGPSFYLPIVRALLIGARTLDTAPFDSTATSKNFLQLSEIVFQKYISDIDDVDKAISLRISLSAIKGQVKWYAESGSKVGTDDPSIIAFVRSDAITDGLMFRKLSNSQYPNVYRWIFFVEARRKYYSILRSMSLSAGRIDDLSDDVWRQFVIYNMKSYVGLLQDAMRESLREPFLIHNWIKDMEEPDSSRMSVWQEGPFLAEAIAAFESGTFGTDDLRKVCGALRMDDIGR